jgi:DNA primase
MPQKNQLIDFRAVRAAVSMEQVLDRYGLLEKFKRSGDSLTGCCPLHQGSNPTQFRVSASKSLWNCFGQCKAGGNTVDFIAKKEGVSAYAAAQLAVEWFSIPPEQAYSAREGTATAPNRSSTPKAPNPEPTAPVIPAKEIAQAASPSEVKPEAIAPNPPLQFRLDKLQRDHPYLTERGLTLETLVDFGVGFCAKGMMAGRIAIPIHNPEGQVVAYAGRHVGEPPAGIPKYKLPPGFRKSLELFNLDRAKLASPDLPLVVVEGFFDAMKLHQLGHRKVVALMGSSLSHAQEELIRRYSSQQSQIVVMLDEDEAGRSARDEITARLARFAFVRAHAFQEEGQQPEHLTAEQLAEVFA